MFLESQNCCAKRVALSKHATPECEEYVNRENLLFNMVESRNCKPGHSGKHECPARDSLAESILYVSRHYGKHMSLETMLSGLPIGQDGRLTPSLAVQAACNVGLVGRIVKTKMEDISAFALPLVLFLKNNDTCVLLEASGDLFTIVQTGSEQETQNISKDDLTQETIGYVLYLLPDKKAEPMIGGELPKPSMSSHWLWGVILANWWPYAQVIAAAVMLNVFALASPLFVMNIYDRIVPNRAMESLWVLAIGVSVVFIFDFLLKTLRAFFIDSTSKKVDIILESRLFDQLLDMRLKDRAASVGSFASLLRELEVLRDFFTSATLTTFVDMPFILIFITLFWYLGGPIAFVFMVVLPITIFIGLLVHLPIKHSVETSMANSYGKHAVLVETLSSMETVKGLGCEDAMRKRWNENTAESARQFIHSKSLSQFAINLTGFVHQIGYVVVIVVGVYLIKEGKLTTGGLVACSMLSGKVFGPFMQIAQIITKLHHTVTAYKELSRVMNFQGERAKGVDFLHRPNIIGHVEFRDATFSYPGSKILSLKNVNLKIAAGERVGIVGKNGSGKSTLGKMVLSLYEPETGAVLVDGTDLRQLDPTDLRRGIGYVPQDISLFQGTVRQNICMPYQQAGDQQVLAAAQISGTNDFIRIHPRGYDLQVGERGCSLSGGQRQSIGIARALIRNPRVLVLDEPTSSMDNQSEALFVARLKQNLADKTIILITHRPILLELVDRLIVMDEGQIVADGPKEKILRMLNSGAVQRMQEQMGAV